MNIEQGSFSTMMVDLLFHFDKMFEECPNAEEIVDDGGEYEMDYS
jgi:hypothetical protein